MKKSIITSLLSIAVLICSFSTLNAQVVDKIVKEERSITEFNSIKAGETFVINYTKADDYKLFVESNESKIENIETKVTDGKLFVVNNNLRSPGTLIIHISAPRLKNITLSGASEFYTKDIIEADELNIRTSGAAIANIELSVNALKIDMHGASEVDVKGTCNNLQSTIDDTAILNANELLSKDAKITNRSRTAANVNVQNNLEIISYSTSKVNYVGEPEYVVKSTIGRNEYRERPYERDEDSFEYRRRDGETRTNFGSIHVTVNDREDSTIVVFGRHQFIVDEYGNARYRKLYRKGFNGNWGGIDIGIAGYLTPNFDMNYPEGYDFLDLNFGRSSRLDINLFEQNLPISKNNHWGFITGVGFEFRSYHFDNNVTLMTGQDEIIGYYNSEPVVKKHKFKVSYINVPFLFEYQTNAYNDRNSFHINIGAVVGLRYASKTKRKFDDKNNSFDLLDGNGVIIENVEYDKRKVKEHDDFNLNPFKVDAMLRFGWGWFNFYATYSVTTMFKKNEGPELYPFSFGMTILKW